MDLSLTSHLGFTLTTYETIQLRQQFITPDIIFAGMSKVEDFADAESVQQIIKDEFAASHIAECGALLAFWYANGVTLRDIRRALRARVGDGGYQHLPEGKISRTDESRQIFARAEEIARAARSEDIRINFMMAAVLELKESHIRRLLQENEFDWEMIYQGLLNIDFQAPEEAPKSSRHGGTGALQVNSVIPKSKKILDDIGRDLVEAARRGELHEAVERDDEIKSILRILRQKSKSNPLLVGDAGVGKTAIIEGLAVLIAKARLTEEFRGIRIIQIEASSLVSGTAYRGAFEERINRIIKEASSDPNLVLFVDEIHMLVGAGGTSGGGSMDAANILKTALDRSTIRLIGATTEAEYRRYIATDPALDRRFNPVTVKEPSQDATRVILRQSRDRLQRHHNVFITDEAIDEAITLSIRYMMNRKLPDKAFSLLDQACSLVSIDDVFIDEENSNKRLNRSEEKVVKPQHVRQALPDGPDIAGPKSNFDLLGMADRLKEKVIGQHEAAEALARAVQRNYAFNDGRKRPVGVFLFVGSTGVGKTEMVRSVAEYLFGSPEAMIRIDMSEYMDRHSQSRLIGSPPGYVGYEQGGQLTGELLKSPRSVVLLDEVEKAHPDILNLFLQVFDAGTLTDGRGQKVDASRALFIMTSNLGITPGLPLSEPMIQMAVRGHFRPELLNRIDETLMFHQLKPHDMNQIVAIHLDRLKKTLAAKQIRLVIQQEVIGYLGDKGYQPEMGARPILRLIDREIKDLVSRKIIADDIVAGDLITISLGSDGIIVTSDLGITGGKGGSA